LIIGILEEHELELSEQNPVKCKSVEKTKQELIYFPNKKNNLLPSQTYAFNTEHSTRKFLLFFSFK